MSLFVDKYNKGWLERTCSTQITDPTHLSTNNHYKYDLTVAYRINDFPTCNGPNKPPIFADDKKKLAQHCLRSFKRALGDLKVQIVVVLTGSNDYCQMFQELWSPEDLHIFNVGKIGGPGSLNLQVKLLSETKLSPFVYLAEDDYYYQPNSIKEAVQTLCEHSAMDFISLYDHPDNHSLSYQKAKRNVSFNKKDIMWTARAATTHTFLTRSSTLKECKDVFKKPRLSPIDADTSHWLSLTKTNLFNLPLRNKYWLFCSIFTWVFRWKQVLFGHRYSLYIPTPSLATHMASGVLAEGIDYTQND